MSFKGKVVVVTGATSGIGRTTAEAFGREHASVVLVGRDRNALAHSRTAVEAAGGSAVACEADVTVAEAPARIIDTAVQHFGGVDVLVNAAGGIASGALGARTDGVWD